MTDRMYKIKEPVVIPHPDVPQEGAGLVIHLPGEEIPWERAVELELVEVDGVQTAEVRRSRPPRKRAAGKAAPAQEQGEGVSTAEVRREPGADDTDSDADGDADGDD